ncbi:MAG: FAD-binding protein, partial [Clostridia bacterium]|nr:FAD-binding protein [Clostridia bacterium]
MSISRRSFLKGAGALGLAATGIFGSVASAEGAEEAKAYEIAATHEYEAVILGCGAAGLMAAMELQAAGVKTALLEKGGSCGVASACMAGGPALANTRVQAAENATVTEETLYKCMYGFSNGTVNGSLLKKCINEGDKVVGNFVDNGVPMGLRIDAYGMGFRARHNFTGADGVQVSGAPRFQPLVDKFVADGGVIEYNREGVSLVKTGDAVTGVIAKNVEDGSFIQYNAKAVLVATGGYAGNDKRLREHYGDIDIVPLCSTLPDGKGFDMV